MANEEKYYDGRTGNLYIRPLICKIQATFSSSGAVVTVSSTRRQSHPGATITGASGTYAIAGLPVGSDYHPMAFHMNTGAGTDLVTLANASVFDASAGTMTFLTRQSSDGVPTAPADATIIYITIEVETGAPS